MRVRIAIVVLKKQEMLHTASSFMSLQLSSMQTHLPHDIVICGLSGYAIFIHFI